MELELEIDKVLLEKNIRSYTSIEIAKLYRNIHDKCCLVWAPKHLTFFKKINKLIDQLPNSDEIKHIIDYADFGNDWEPLFNLGEETISMKIT